MAKICVLCLTPLRNSFFFLRHCFICDNPAIPYHTIPSLLCNRSGRSHATLPVPMRGNGECCMTPARADAKETIPYSRINFSIHSTQAILGKSVQLTLTVSVKLAAATGMLMARLNLKNKSLYSECIRNSTAVKSAAHTVQPQLMVTCTSL